MRQLAGRVAVVTGAASGIGRALSEALAAKGCHLALVDVDREGLSSLAGDVGVHGVHASTHVIDVANRAEMQALPEAVLREHGHVHILVNNAGVSVTGTIEEQSIEDFEWIMGINLWGVIHGCKFFLPYLKAEEEGHIVNLSSLFGIVGIPTQGSYNVTKFGVRGLSEALDAELASTDVGVSVVHPGGVRTNIVRSGRLAQDQRRARLEARFERFGMAPEKAAGKIVRAIERGRFRVRIGPETYLLDWAKRLFPVWTQKAIAAGFARGQGRES